MTELEKKCLLAFSTEVKSHLLPQAIYKILCKITTMKRTCGEASLNRPKTQDE